MRRVGFELRTEKHSREGYEKHERRELSVVAANVGILQALYSIFVLGLRLCGLGGR